MEAPNVVWEQKTHPAGTVQNEVAHEPLLKAKTCSRTEEEHHFYHCHARKDVLQSNSCHVVRLVAEEAEVDAQGH